MKAAGSLIDYYNAWLVAHIEVDMNRTKQPRTVLKLQPLLTVQQYVAHVRSRDNKFADRLMIDVKRFFMRVRRLNELVAKANNTRSHKRFKQYLVEAYFLMYGQYPEA